jgi:hypothetical protein
MTKAFLAGQKALVLDELEYVFEPIDETGLLSVLPRNEDFENDERTVNKLFPKFGWWRDNGGTGLMTADINTKEAEEVLNVLTGLGATFDEPTEI